MFLRPRIGMLSSVETVVLSNAQNVVAASLGWGTGVWASSKPKRIIIPEGVVIGSLDVSLPALRVHGTWGGQLDILNFGFIDGAGGQPNGGDGGDALLVNSHSLDVRLHNYGGLRAGGGGGGRGGKGGAGEYDTLQVQGPEYGIFPSTLYYWRKAAIVDTITIYWNGTLVANAVPASSQTTTYQSGQWLYRRKTHQGEGYYAVSRERTTTTSTEGGNGGNGGRGQGYSQSAQSGSSGSNGGQNAGKGGTGGTGGGRGQNGASGSVGFSGNVGSGLSGLSGGTRGYALSGEDYVNLVVASGSMLGRVQ